MVVDRLAPPEGADNRHIVSSKIGMGTASCRLRLKCDGARAETRFRLSAKWTSLFKSAGASIRSTTGSRGVHISGSDAGYTMFRGSVKCTGYPLHSPVFPFTSLTRASPCAITFQLDSTEGRTGSNKEFYWRFTREQSPAVCHYLPCNTWNFKAHLYVILEK
jgi:hypothetical protein